MQKHSGQVVLRRNLPALAVNHEMPLKSTPTTPKLPETAVILAAGPMPEGMRVLFGECASAMVPVNGSPLIHLSLKYLAKLGVKRAVVGIAEKEQRLSLFLQNGASQMVETELGACPPVIAWVPATRF